MQYLNLTYYNSVLISAPKIHTNLLWDLTILFFGLGVLYFVGVFFFRNKLTSKTNKRKARKKELSPMISEFLFYEEEATKEEKSVYVGLKIEIRELIKDKYNKQILSEILLDLQKDVSGNTRKRLFKLYVDLGLHLDAFEKLKSWRWEKVSKGIIELTQMHVEESYAFITKFINDKRTVVRKQAEIATVTLKHDGLNYFMDNTRHKVSQWQQLKLLNVIINKEDYLPPRFKAWLTSKNKDIVLFALRLIKHYNQNDAKKSITELVKHKNNQIKVEAIDCIKKFNITESLDTLKNIFWNSSVDIKLSILDAIAVLGKKKEIEFLKIIEKKESNFNIKSKALSVINTIAPETILPTDGIEELIYEIDELEELPETEDILEELQNQFLEEDEIGLGFLPIITDEDVIENIDSDIPEIIKNTLTVEEDEEKIAYKLIAIEPTNLELPEVNSIEDESIIVNSEEEKNEEFNFIQHDNITEVLGKIEDLQQEYLNEKEETELNSLSVINNEEIIVDDIRVFDIVEIIGNEPDGNNEDNWLDEEEFINDNLDENEEFSLKNIELVIDKHESNELVEIGFSDLLEEKEEITNDNDFLERSIIDDYNTYFEKDNYNKVLLLDTLEDAKDKRDIPLLKEIINKEEKELIRNKAIEILNDISLKENDSNAEDTSINEIQDLKGVSIFKQLFAASDEELKLMLLDQILDLGEEKEIDFLKTLLTDGNIKIQQKAAKIITKLNERNTLSIEVNKEEEISNEEVIETIINKELKPINSIDFDANEILDFSKEVIFEDKSKKPNTSSKTNINSNDAEFNIKDSKDLMPLEFCFLLDELEIELSKPFNILDINFELEEKSIQKVEKTIQDGVINEGDILEVSKTEQSLLNQLFEIGLKIKDKFSG